MAEVRNQLVAVIRKQLNKAARLHAQSREAMDRAQDAAASGEVAADAEPEDERQPPGEQVVPSTDEWIRLHKLTGLPIATLQRKVQSPYDCRLVVSREAPSISAGRKILCGEFPEFSQEFPFNLEDLKQSIATKFGGDLWRLSIQDSAGQVIRDVRLRLALPPLNPGEAPEDPDDDGPEPNLPEDFRGPPAHDLDAGMDDILEVEKKRYHIAAVRKGRKDMEAEAQSPEEDKFAQILEALKEKGGGGGGEMTVLVSAMQAQAQQQQRSLELVLSGLADKMSNQQTSQLQMFDILAKMMDSKSAAQAEVARVQMEGKRTEMDMMMRMIDGRREDKDLAMDKMLELLQLGMQWKTGTVPQAEGEATAEKPDWIASLVQGLATLISSKVAIPAVDSAAAAPQLTMAPAAEPAPPTAEAQEAQSKKLAAIAEAAAKNAVARHKARQEVIAARRKAQAANGNAPVEGQPAAEAVPETSAEQCKALMSELLSTALLEVEELPVRSKTVQLAFDRAPAEWRAKLCSTGNALELASYFKPYADMVLVKQIEAKIAPSPEKQQWLMTQAGILRNAFIRQAASIAQPPPRPGSGPSAPAAAPATPPTPSTGSGPSAAETGGPANA